MQLPGLQALGLTPPSFQFAGLNGNNSIQTPGLSTQDPQGSQALGGPSAGLQALSGLPPAMGSGATNFAGLGPNAFNTIGASPLTPTYSPLQRGLSAQAGLPGGKLNYTC
jgi:hypothetical protein